MTETASTPRRAVSGTTPVATRTSRRLRHFEWSEPREVGTAAFAAGVAASTVAVASFVLARLLAWPPHEDETLALFVGRGSLGEAFGIVLGERGGAPLHFLLASVVAHAGGGLTALRLLSAFFAIASVPLVALLARRLAGRTTALAATALVSGSWVLLFHAVYGRMYSLFLFTSALSYLALLAALDRGGRRRFGLWGVAAVVMIASHPYGALVYASQGAYVLLRRTRVRDALVAGTVVGLVCIPFWRADLVLAGRFDVGVGGGGDKLGAPLPVLRYLRTVAGDFSSGYAFVLPFVLALAAVGAWYLWRARRESALLVAAVIGTPALAFLVARLGSSTSPESRHLIFALPFFAVLVAAGLLVITRQHRQAGTRIAVAAIAVLVAAEVAWAAEKTRPLFVGEPDVRASARAEASEWLAATSRPDDILFGYDPLFLGAWERNRNLTRIVIPRADATLARAELESLPRPLGRGVWVFDASDTNNFIRRFHVPLRYPYPRDAYEARVFGPFLVVRTVGPTETPARFLLRSMQVMRLGRSLYMGDADVNLVTVRKAAEAYGPLPGEP